MNLNQLFVVKEAQTRNPDLMSPGDYDRHQQAQMDFNKRDFKRREHEAEWEQEQAYSKQLAARDAGTWYVRVNGKIVKDKQGNPYTFNGKSAANKAAVTMQTKPFNKGKQFMLTTNPNDTVEEGASIAMTPGSIEPGGAVDNFKQQMANNTEIAYKKGVAEGLEDTVNFEVDSENAYNHVMAKFGKVISWNGNDMVAPRQYWGTIQQLAHDAGGSAEEVGHEQGVAEGYWQDAVKKAEASREARKGKPFEKNPASHDKQGVYKGDKDLAGRLVPKRKEQGVAEDREYIPSGKERITRNGIDLVVGIDGATVDIRAMTGDSQMAYVVFDRDGDTLVADDLAVEEQYKGQGIAKIMYDYVKELGFRVKRSSDQLVAGKKFWDKNKGAENNIWEQGVAEAAKWRSDPDAYDVDDEGNKTPRNPNSPKFGYDPLQRRADTANDAKTPRGKTAALKTSLKMAKGNKGVAEGSTSKEKQKTPYRDINSSEYKAAVEKQKEKMAKDNAAEPGKKLLGKIEKQGVAEGEAQQLSVQQLAAISDEALDNEYHYGRSTPGNSFGWQANLKSAAYAKQIIDQGETDIEAISDAIHKGWNVTAQAFVQNPDQFDDTPKLQAAGKLEAKLQQRAELMKKNYAQLPEDEKEKDRVVARALLQAITGGSEQGVAEAANPAQQAAIAINMKKHHQKPKSESATDGLTESKISYKPKHRKF